MTDRNGWSPEDVQRWKDDREEEARERAVRATAVAETVVALVVPGLAWVWCAALMLRPDPTARGKGVLMAVWAALNFALLVAAEKLLA